MDQAFDLSAVRIAHRGLRVVDARTKGEKLLLTVDGEGGANRVLFAPDQESGGLRCACTCPWPGRCGHVEAARLVIDRHEGLARWAKAARATGKKPASAAAEASSPAGQGVRPTPPSNPKPRSEACARPDGLSTLLDGWLQALEGAAATAPRAVAGKAERAPLAYVFEVSSQHTLCVSAWRCRRLETGDLVPNRPLSLGSALRSSVQTLPPGDVGFVAELQRGLGKWDQQVELGPAAHDLVHRLMATGRCQAAGASRLTAGEPRDGALTWRVVGDRQVPAVEVDGGGEAVLFDEPIYLDAARGLLGPLQMEVEPAAARAFLAGPPLSPEVTAALRPAHRQRLAKLRLPLPRTITVDVCEAPVPVPCLTLYSQTIESMSLRHPLVIDGANLRFRYGPHDVPAQGGAQEFTVIDGDVARRHGRRHDDEKAARDMLINLGFEPILDVVSDPRATIVRMNLARHERAADLTLAAGLADPAAEAWRRFVQEERPELLHAGWQITIDRSFRHGAVAVERWVAAVAPSPVGGWFEVELGVELGADAERERIDLLPTLLKILREDPEVLDRAVAEGVGLAIELPDGRRLELPAGRLKKIVDVLLEMQVGGRIEKGKLRVAQAMVAQASALEAQVDAFTWAGGDALRSLAEKLASFDAVARVPVPANLRAELRPYQLDGLAWLQFLRAHDLGGVLADDMGLGKTVQALAHLLVEKAAGRLDRPALVVTPTSVVRNWAAEAARFAPDLRVLVLHGGDRHASFQRMGEVDLVLTTYPLVLRDEETLAAQPFHLLLLDEAQAIKNARAKVARALRRLDARHRLCLTGTPLENNLTELWAQFDFLMPGVLGDAKTFGRVFRAPIEKGNDDDRRRSLAQRVRPFVLRRTKATVAKELPPKTEIVQTIELCGAQRDLYESIRLSVHEAVQRAIAEQGLDQAQIVILDALLKLRQVCCDPRLVKLDAAKSVADSAKLDALLDLLPALLEEGRRVLLFSQFTSMLALIEAALGARGIAFVKLTGDTRDRQTPIRRFQAGEVPVFLISLKAGGTGLNLTAADTVIHYDPWWNPAAEQQATDRAHRIGQDKPVFVYKLIVAGSVEERIAGLQARKRALAAGILDGEGRQGTALTKGDVEALLAPIEA